MKELRTEVVKKMDTLAEERMKTVELAKKLE